MNTLFTCAGRRNYLAGYFRDACGGNAKIIGADMDPSAPALQECDMAYVVPSVFDPGYIDSIIDICANERVDLVISLNDHELPLISREKARIEATGAKVLVSRPQIIDLCFDKRSSARWINALGLRSPRTEVSIDTVLKALERGEMHFPLIVKPRWGSASIAVHEVHSVEELQAVAIIVRAQLTRAGLVPTDANNRPDPYSLLIQQKICGREYGIDVLNDLDGKTQCVYVKEKLAMRSGETDRATLRNMPELTEIGEKIGASLGHIGNLDCDVLVEDGVAYVLELNPRFGGGYPFSHAAGADYPLAITHWLTGEPTNYEAFGRRYDVVFSKADRILDVRGTAYDVHDVFRRRVNEG